MIRRRHLSTRRLFHPRLGHHRTPSQSRSTQSCKNLGSWNGRESFLTGQLTLILTPDTLEVIFSSDLSTGGSSIFNYSSLR